jgi:hypothetical protein
LEHAVSCPENRAREEFLTYNKAALVSFIFDREIRLATPGRRKMTGLLCDPYSRFGAYRNGFVTDEIVEEAWKRIEFVL